MITGDYCVCLRCTLTLSCHALHFIGPYGPIGRKFVKNLRYLPLTSNLAQKNIVELANHWPCFVAIG